MSRLEISIPSTSTSPPPSPHTVYHLTLRLPLRTLSLQKRYSDFVTFHSTLTSQASNTAPPASLPSKTIFSSTLKNPALVEQRRQGLEAYLRAINDSPDPRWRSTSAWRSFLGLPSASSNASLAGTTAASSLASLATQASGPITDPVAWLDAHRELKTHLHAARSHIADREAVTGTAGAATASHEAAAQAKKALVKAGALLAPLEKGLRDNGAEWSRNRLGEGEVRRRKDLLAAARREVEGLENLAALVGRKADADAAVRDLSSGAGAQGGAASADKVALLETSKDKNPRGVGKGRVLGKETARTRELDNRGVLQLQQQIMKDQDEDVNDLAQVVRRQKELGLEIQRELEEQDNMLKLLDEDVDRTQAKLKVARKRADQIS